MSASDSGELTASSVIELIESGAYPRDVVTTIARGLRGWLRLVLRGAA